MSRDGSKVSEDILVLAIGGLRSAHILGDFRKKREKMSLTTSTDNIGVTQESIKVYQERARMDLVQGGFKGCPVNISSGRMGFKEHQMSTLLA